MKLKIINARLCNNIGTPIWSHLLFENLHENGDGTYSVRWLNEDNDSVWTPGVLRSIGGYVCFAAIDGTTILSKFPWEE